MAAGLAVGIPGDTFSIADSGLGRSSVIAGTTAQFSEVSQISLTATGQICSNVPYSIPRICLTENYVILTWEWDML